MTDDELHDAAIVLFLTRIQAQGRDVDKMSEAELDETVERAVFDIQCAAGTA